MNQGGGTTSADVPAPDTQVLSDTVYDGGITLEGITWASTPAFDGNTAATYLFTSILPAGYAVEEGVRLPEITVTVESAAMNEILAVKKTYDALTAGGKALIDETCTAKLLELAEMAQPKAITPPDAGFGADAFAGTQDAKAVTMQM